MDIDGGFARRHAGAVSWPQLLGVIGAVLLSLWLYQRYQVNKTYHQVVIAQAFDLLRFGQQEVEATVLSGFALPKPSEEKGFSPVEATLTAPDISVRVRYEMLDNGELKVNLDGWKFRNATLMLVPTLTHNTLSWKCTSSGIPAEWVRDGCTQMEQRVTQGAFGDSPGRAPAEDAGIAAVIGAAPKRDLWQPPFQSQGPLSGAAVDIADGLRQLEPFQSAIQDFFSANKRLPSSSDEFQSRFTPEQLQLKAGAREMTVSVDSDATIYIGFDGFGGERLMLEVKPYIAESNRLEWECDLQLNLVVELPQECKWRQ